jgi:hypothetical protein
MYDVRHQCQNFKDHVYKIMVEGMKSAQVVRFCHLRMGKPRRLLQAVIPNPPWHPTLVPTINTIVTTSFRSLHLFPLSQ